MAPHSSTLAWKIPQMEKPGRLLSMGLLRVGHDWATSLWLFTFVHWRRKWQAFPSFILFLPGESQGWGSLVGCRLGGCTVGHDWSDLAAARRGPPRKITRHPNKACGAKEKTHTTVYNHGNQRKAVDKKKGGTYTVLGINMSLDLTSNTGHYYFFSFFEKTKLTLQRFSNTPFHEKKILINILYHIFQFQYWQLLFSINLTVWQRELLPIKSEQPLCVFPLHLSHKPTMIGTEDITQNKIKQILCP